MKYAGNKKNKKMGIAFDHKSMQSQHIISQDANLKNVLRRRVRSEEISNCLENSTVYKNDSFNWVHYLLMYPDLVDANILTCHQAIMHWNINGKSENRKAILNNDQMGEYLYLYIHLKNLLQGNFFDNNIEMDIINKYSEEDKSLFERYPNMFHKYLLYLKDPTDKMSYKVSKIVTIDKKMICSIHCYDLNFLHEYFNEFFDLLRRHFLIVVTYCVENMNVINTYDFVFLCINNSGMDIGGKFVCVDFLKYYNIDYTQIFFVHSKSDLEKRKAYIMPFISNMEGIINLLNKDSTVGGIFPNLFHFGGHSIATLLISEKANTFNYGLNSNIIDEMTRYFDFPDSLLFTEGNFYILNKDIANDLFGDLKIYNVLNDSNSFDYNWVKSFYFLEGSLIDVYSHFKKHNLFGNTNYYNMNTSQRNMVRDFMIEHAFERIVIPAVIKKNKKIKCANLENTGLDKVIKNLLYFINDLSVKKSYTLNNVLDYVNKSVSGQFKYLDYLKLNQDLVPHIHSNEEAIKHWLIHGIKENRSFNCDYVNSEYTDFLNKKFDVEIFNLNITYFSNSNFSKKKSDQIIYKNCKIEEFIENIPKTTIDILFNYNCLFFIVDFPILGGGTTIFLDTIVSKYKENQTFLICRRFRDKIYFFINDEILLERGFDDNEFIDIVNTWSFKITKIFINSTVGHKKSTIDFILNLNKHTATITHDHSSIYKEFQMYYHDQFHQDVSQYTVDFDKINCLVTQNEKNISVFGKFLNNKQDIVVSDLPDYKKSSLKVETSNENIVIGVNGNISFIKGHVILKKFMEKISHWGNVKLVVFGHCLDPGYPYQYRYSNIHEFNNLVEQHKPNLWFETSMWPETYSYTLTQMMLSQLPILYQKKNYPSVIETRLSSYSKAYSFDNVDDLSYELICSLKQNFFYNIEPVIYYGKFWDNYFENETNMPLQPSGKNVVFISSKIYTSNAAFTYSDKRSIYSPNERFQQTLNTISTIRIYVPNSYIILFDNSEFSSAQLNKLNSVLDLFLNIQTNPVINDYTNVKTTKAYGELAQTHAVLKHIKTNMNYLNVKQFFKISGRYLINETFDYSNYDNESNVFKRNSAVTDRHYYYTSFYNISGSNFNNYCETIANIYNYSQVSDDYYNVDWEVILASHLNYNFIEIPNLGITQNIAVWNQRDQI
jgi:hypothetical protein